MNYSSLLAQVVDTLGSQVTTTQVAAMLPFVEARFNRIIVHPERETTTTFTPTSDITLPSDCWQLRDIWLDGSPDTTLEQMSPDEARRAHGLTTGAPVAYVVSGSTIDLFPTPDATSDDVIYVRYLATIPALSDSQTTNWLLSDHPDAYYYGLLLQCEAYIANDERLPIWKAALDETLAEIDRNGAKRRYGASPLVRKPFNYA